MRLVTLIHRRLSLIALAANSAFAANVGPSMPEYQASSILERPDMVNLYSGTLNYSIPLMKLPVPGLAEGYPIVLDYNNKVRPSMETGWVGLGWGITTGAVNRTVSVVPDDFENSSDNVTVTVTGDRVVKSESRSFLDLFKWDTEKGVGTNVMNIVDGILVSDNAPVVQAGYSGHFNFSTYAGNFGIGGISTPVTVYGSSYNFGAAAGVVLYQKHHYEAYINANASYKYNGFLNYSKHTTLSDGKRIEFYASRKGWNIQRFAHSEGNSLDGRIEAGQSGFFAPTKDSYAMNSPFGSGAFSPFRKTVGGFIGQSFETVMGKPLIDYPEIGDTRAFDPESEDLYWRFLDDPGGAKLQDWSAPTDKTRQPIPVASQKITPVLSANELVGFTIVDKMGYTYEYMEPVYAYDTFLEGAATNSPLSGFRSTLKMLKRYATDFLLTAVKGPDYVDRGAAGISGDDYGSWIRLGYDNLTPGARKYNWRVPYEGLVESSIKSRPNSKDDQDILWFRQGFQFEEGRKDVKYPKFAESKSHVLLFYGGIREDGLEAFNQYALGSNVNNDALGSDVVYKATKQADGFFKVLSTQASLPFANGSPYYGFYTTPANGSNNSFPYIDGVHTATFSEVSSVLEGSARAWKFKVSSGANVPAGNIYFFKPIANVLSYKKLDRIRLFAKGNAFPGDQVWDGTESKVTDKQVSYATFEYDYSMMETGRRKFVGPSGQNGVLTLKGLYMGGSVEEATKKSKYRFDYNLGTATLPRINTVRTEMFDRFGYFKSNGAENKHMPVPGDQWALTLKKVTLPSGGTMEFEYESNRAKYIGDKPYCQWERPDFHYKHWVNPNTNVGDNGTKVDFNVGSSNWNNPNATIPKQNSILVAADGDVLEIRGVETSHVTHQDFEMPELINDPGTKIKGFHVVVGFSAFAKTGFGFNSCEEGARHRVRILGQDASGGWTDLTVDRGDGGNWAVCPRNEYAVHHFYTTVNPAIDLDKFLKFRVIMNARNNGCEYPSLGTIIDINYDWWKVYAIVDKDDAELYGFGSRVKKVTYNPGLGFPSIVDTYDYQDGSVTWISPSFQPNEDRPLAERLNDYPVLLPADKLFYGMATVTRSNQGKQEYRFFTPADLPIQADAVDITPGGGNGGGLDASAYRVTVVNNARSYGLPKSVISYRWLPDYGIHGVTGQRKEFEYVNSLSLAGWKGNVTGSEGGKIEIGSIASRTPASPNTNQAQMGEIQEHYYWKHHGNQYVAESAELRLYTPSFTLVNIRSQQTDRSRESDARNAIFDYKSGSPIQTVLESPYTSQDASRKKISTTRLPAYWRNANLESKNCLTLIGEEIRHASPGTLFPTDNVRSALFRKFDGLGHPVEEYAWRGTPEGTANFTHPWTNGAYSFGSAFVRSRLDEYGNYGNLVSTKDANGRESFLTYSNNFGRIASVFANCPKGGAAYFSAEEDYNLTVSGVAYWDLQAQWEKLSGTTLSSVRAYSGRQSAKVVNGPGPAVRIKPVNAGTGFLVTAWVWTESGTPALNIERRSSANAVLGAILVGAPVGEPVQAGKWQLWRRNVSQAELLQFAGVDNLRIYFSGAGSTFYVDDFRAHPENASAESYSYDPQGNMLGKLDDNNVITRFKYDTDQNLREIRNSKDELISAGKLIRSAELEGN